MSMGVIVCCAMVLDAVMGEPRLVWSRLPHPAVVMGRLVDLLDRLLNRRSRVLGVLAVAVLVCVGVSVGFGLSLLGPVAEILVIATLLAQKSLVQHVRAVASALRLSVEDGRRSVAQIVSRDTEGMTRAQIARAALESGAENLSDGVVAPAFWALVAGLPGIVIYKLINTADSMIGYKTEQHHAFGWAAARLDDALNWIPARLTAGLIWVVGGARGTWAEIAADARQHKSPNAGWPEAALARSLDVALAGPRQYHGRMQTLPWVNAQGRREIGAAEINKAVKHLWRVWGVSVMVLASLGVVI